jgi:formylmethanofuran dehydrogenase subunit E
MSKPAKDEAALLKRVGEAIRKSVIQPGCCMEDTGCQIGPCNCSKEAGKAALAAIRKAGWAVVPVELLEEAASTLESLCDIEHIHRDKYPDEQRRYSRDIEFPKSIRAMIAAAPGVKP